MNCEQTTELLSDRLKGLLAAADERTLDEHLAGCPVCRAEADAITELWTGMTALDEADVPTQRMRARFHAGLAAYEERAAGGALDRFLATFWPRRPAAQAALAVALALVGVAVGHSLPSATDREIAELRSDVRTVGLVLLGHPSASERLRAVDWSRGFESDPGVVSALLETVRYDGSVNVRLAAVEALRAQLTQPRVAAALVAALDGEQAPLVQVTIANALLEARVSGAVAALERLQQRADLDPSVRDYLSTALQDAGAGAPRPNA